MPKSESCSSTSKLCGLELCRTSLCLTYVIYEMGISTVSTSQGYCEFTLLYLVCDQHPIMMAVDAVTAIYETVITLAACCLGDTVRRWQGSRASETYILLLLPHSAHINGNHAR